MGTTTTTPFLSGPTSREYVPFVFTDILQSSLRETIIAHGFHKVKKEVASHHLSPMT
jgi:hypothetical protein